LAGYLIWLLFLVKLKSSLRKFYGLGWSLWNICVTNDHGYVPLVLNTFRSFPHSWHISGFVTRLTRRVSLVKHALLTLPEHMSSPPIFSGVHATRSLVLYICFVDCCLSFCSFSFGHCVVCSSSIYELLLPLWYLQSLLVKCVSDCMKRCFEMPNFWTLTWNVTSICLCFKMYNVYTLYLVLLFCLDILPILYNNYLFCNRRNLLTILYLGCVLVWIDAPFLHYEYGGLFEGWQWKGKLIYCVMWLNVHWRLIIFRLLFFLCLYVVVNHL
jgi:hypothetical protein